MKNRLIFKEIFYFLTISVLVFAALELFWPNLILAYFNLNLLLILWGIIAIIQLVITKK